MRTLTIAKPDDFHVHLRRNSQTPLYLRKHGEGFARILVMPNTVPPINSDASIAEYRQLLQSEAAEVQFYLTVKLNPNIKPESILQWKKQGILAGKYYPQGSTTNSGDGIKNWEQIAGVLEAMEACGLVLSVHGEEADGPYVYREKAFLPILDKILQRYPKLKIVAEHVSCRESVAWVCNSSPNVAATVTAHHLFFTVDDLFADRFKPELFCMPILKTKKDQESLRRAVFSQNPRFFFGSDSAPHPLTAKLSTPVPAGCYTAATALSMLVQLWDKECSLDKLENFVSGFGSAFYQLPKNKQLVTLEQKPWRVPLESEGCIPACAGSILEWRIQS